MFNKNNADHQKRPQCKFGLQCSKQPDCWFKHSISTQIDKQSNLHSSKFSNSSKISQGKGSNKSKIGKNKNHQKSDVKSNKKCRYGVQCFTKDCHFKHPNKEESKTQNNPSESLNVDNEDFDELSYVQLQPSMKSNSLVGFQGQTKSQIQPKLDNRISYEQPYYPNSQIYPQLRYSNNQNQMIQFQRLSQNYPQLYQNQANVNQYKPYRYSSNFSDSFLQSSMKSNEQNYNIYPNIPTQYYQIQNSNNVAYLNPMIINQSNQYAFSNKNMLSNQCPREQYKRHKIFKQKKQEMECESDLSQDSDAVQNIKKNKEKISINNVKLKSNPQQKFKNLLKKVVQNFFHKATPEEIAINQLHKFLNHYNVNNDHQQTIWELVQQNKLSYQDINDLVKILQFLTKEGFKQYYAYPKMAKHVINKKFNIGLITKKLNQGKNSIIKKRNKQTQLYKKFPNPKQIQFLQEKELLELNLKETIFLIDGNNVLVTNNVFRHYFQSQQQQLKIQAQIRLNWILAYTLQGTLFFDEYFDKQIGQKIKIQIMNQQQRKIVNKQNSIQVIYAKQKDKKAIADQKIIEKLKYIKQFLQNIPQQDRYQVILVSADRILTQQCLLIMKIKKTSGKQFIKFCKKALVKKYSNDSSKIGIIKKIFNYRY